MFVTQTLKEWLIESVLHNSNDRAQEKIWLLHIRGTKCKLSHARLLTVAVHQWTGWNVLDEVRVKLHLGNSLLDASCSWPPTEDIILWQLPWLCNLSQARNHCWSFHQNYVVLPYIANLKENMMARIPG